MGWMQSTNPNDDRKALVTEILQRYTPQDGAGYKLVDHSQSGNELYLVLEHPQGFKFIVLYLLRGPARGSGDGWGYKDMDESMGPNYYRCPERLLAQSEVEDKHGWREECRRRRRQAAERRRWAQRLKSGDTLELHRGWALNETTRRQEATYREAVFVRPYSKTFFVGRWVGESTLYRMRWADVKVAEEDAA